MYIKYICIFIIYFFQIFLKIYFNLDKLFLHQSLHFKCDKRKQIINSARLDLCQGYSDGSINSDIRGRREFRLGFMLQFITISASSRVGLLHRRLKSVRIDPWYCDATMSGNFVVEIRLIKYIDTFFSVESYCHGWWRIIVVAVHLAGTNIRNN